MAADITKEDVIEYISNMTVLELSDFVKELEEKFGVTAAAPLAVAAATPVNLSAEQIAEQYPDAAVALIDRGAKAERERIATILQHEQAAGRQQLAEHLAFRTTLGVEEAAGMLAASPKQVVEAIAPGAKPSPFETAMAAIDNPDIGAGHYRLGHQHIHGFVY